MLQKKDLAKEFSLIVQQEIKNHNSAILACNSSLDEIRRNIDLIDDKNSKKISSLASSHSNDQMYLRSIENKVNEFFSSFNRRINDLTAIVQSKFAECIKTMDAKESYFLKIDDFKKFEERLDVWTAQLKFLFSSQKDVLLSKISEAIKTVEKNNVERIKNADKCIQDTQKHCEDLEKSVDIFAVNFSGYSRELEVLKKRCFVIDKNIENIYTQIERLKERC